MVALRVIFLTFNAADHENILLDDEGPPEHPWADGYLS